MTEAERRLWYHLRDRRFLGYKFRRQCPIGPYVVDFVCLSERLVIELDGSQHLDSPTDAIRARFIQGEGFTLLRFWNNEALANTAAVCDRIAHWLGTSGRAPSMPGTAGVP
jgi:very-short-patch-repair endonuclease